MPAEYTAQGKIKRAKSNGAGGFVSDLAISAPGAPSFTVNKTSTSITAVITDSAGATSYESSVDGVTWVAGLTVSGLTPETLYTFRVRGINSGGTGPATSQGVTTNAAENPIAGFSPASGFTLSDNGDGTLRITDAQARLGAKPNAAKPVWFFDFGGGSDQPHPTLSRQQLVLNWSSQCVPTTAVAKAGATHSMTIDTESAAKGGPVFVGGDKVLKLPVNPGGKYYRYFDVYNDFTQPELNSSVSANAGSSFENLKMHRWQSADAQTVTGSPYTITTLQAYKYDIQFAGSGTPYQVFYDTRTQLPSKVWTVEEEYHKVSSAAAAADAYCTGVVNGERKFTISGFDSHRGFDPQGANRWENYKVANFDRWALPGVAPWRANVLYVDDSWCRVFITDKATWVDSETRAQEIQVPTAWAAGGVDFHKRQGAFASLAGKYLWVVDNDDNKILIGSWP